MEQQRRNAFRLIRDGVSPLGWRYPAFVVGTLLSGLVALLPAQFFRFFTLGLQTPPADISRFLIRLAELGALVGVALLLSSLASMLFQEWLRVRLEAFFRREMMHRLQSIPLSRLDGAQKGDWLTRMTGDLSRVESFLTESIPSQIRHAAVVVGAGALFLNRGGAVALVPMGAALALALLHFKVQRKLAPALGELRTLHGSVFHLLIEGLEGVRTIRTQGAQSEVMSRFDGKIREISRKSLNVVGILGMLFGGTEFVGHLMVTACLTAVAWSLSRGGLTLSDALLYPFFIGLFHGSAQGLAGGAYNWNRFFIEGGRLADLLYEDSPISSDDVPRPSLEEAETLEIDRLEFGFGGRPLLPPVSFRLQTGQLVAIVGASGCGKSTFLEVLSGLRPLLSGDLRVKGSRDELLWRSGKALVPTDVCAYVEQSPYLFEGTLGENLRLGSTGAVDEGRLLAALDEVGLTEFRKKYGGLSHGLKEGGRNLSQGERYRVALARALMLERPFLLLDEPFAALDEASVSVVIEALHRRKSVQGILVVTHYLPDALLPDRIVPFRADPGKENKGSRVFQFEGSSAGSWPAAGVIAGSGVESTPSITQEGP